MNGSGCVPEKIVFIQTGRGAQFIKHPQKCPYSKKTCFGKDMEKSELSDFVGATVLEKCLAISQKVKYNYHTTQKFHSCVEFYQRKMKIFSKQTKTFT